MYLVELNFLHGQNVYSCQAMNLIQKRLWAGEVVCTTDLQSLFLLMASKKNNFFFARKHLQIQKRKVQSEFAF